MTPSVLMGRVGGLAAALGAGAVIALAAASPASADDSGSPDAGSRPSVAQHRSGPATAGHPAAAVTERRGHAVAAASDPVKPAAVVSASRTVRSAAHAVPAIPAAVQPAAAAPVAPAAATPSPAPATAASATATPMASSLGSLFDPRGRRITVFKGVHFVTPQSWAFFVKQVSGTGTFTPDSAYDLKDVDQYDWNKFTGIAFSPLQHDRNSAMVGWRYNLKTQEFEIAPFYNVDQKRILPNEQTEVISVPADATFQYTVDYTGVTISYGDQTVYKPYPTGLTPNIWTATRVSGWFGGNEVAPRKITYYLKLR